MKFSQKRTCKNCTMADEMQCDVVKSIANDDGNIPGRMLPRIPKEPCFKPITNRDWSSFIRSEQYTQSNHLELIRLEADTKS